jgi:hypothetical protein
MVGGLTCCTAEGIAPLPSIAEGMIRIVVHAGTRLKQYTVISHQTMRALPNVTVICPGRSPLPKRGHCNVPRRDALHGLRLSKLQG